ncbi:MAG: hypothetical protein GX614_05775 [Sandaracinaceae bacterium]|nr:hypothetical protein [Sandaracinaceae bacterium]
MVQKLTETETAEELAEELEGGVRTVKEYAVSAGPGGWAIPLIIGIALAVLVTISAMLPGFLSRPIW